MATGIEIWMRAGDADYEPALRLLECRVDVEREAIEITHMNPMRRNPDRTLKAVLAAWFTLQPAPPRFVVDPRSGFREFAAGLRMQPRMDGEAEEIISGAFAGVFDLMRSAGRARVCNDGEYVADAMFTEAEPRGRRMSFTAYVYPKE